MRSKLNRVSFAALALALAVAASLSACGQKRLPTGSAGMKLGGAETGCLAKAGPKVESFFKGEASEQDVVSVWDCASGSLQLFVDRTRGAKPGVYTPEELRAFLEKYFLDGKTISDGLLAEMMELKRVLVGGGATELDRGDITRVRELFATFKAQSLAVRTHLPITPEALAARPEERREQALEVLHGVARAIGGALEDHGAPYSIRHLDAFASEFRSCFGDELIPALTHLHQNLEFAQQAKGLAVGAPAEAIRGDEWRHALGALARWYGVYARAYSLDSQRPMDWYLGEGAEPVSRIARDALQLLNEALERRPEGEYRFEELAKLLQTALPESRWEGLLAEALQLKRALLGGDARAITREDLSRLGELVQLYREHGPALQPLLPLEPEALSRRPSADRARVLATFGAAAQAFGDFAARSGQTYALARLVSLSRELRAHSEDLGSFGARLEPYFDAVERNLELIQSAKSLVISAPGDRISAQDWGIAASSAVRAYGVYLHGLRAWNAEGPMLVGPRRDELAGALREAIAWLDSALARHPGEQFPMSEIASTLNLAIPDGITVLGNRTITLAHIQAAVKPLIQNVFGGTEPGPTGRTATGLTRPALKRLWRGFERWNAGQRYLEAAFRAAGGSLDLRAPGFLPAQLEPWTVDRLLTGGWLTLETESLPEGWGRPIMLDAASRLRKIIAEDRPLFPRDSMRIVLDGQRADKRHSLNNLTEANWMHSATRTLWEGFVPAGTPLTDEGLKVDLPLFKRMEALINDIGIDIKYVDPADHLLAEKRFREASLFTFATTGEKSLNVRQFAQLLAFMLSGKRLADSIHADIIARGCKTGPIDIFDYLTIDPQCYRKAFFSNIDGYWRQTPRLAAFRKGTEGWLRELFDESVEAGARKQGVTEQLMNSSDSEGFGMISHYVEAVFTRYDEDDSGNIDWAEAAKAFPVFRGTLAEFSCQLGTCLTSHEDLWAVFTYLLGHGFAPSKAAFVRWRYIKVGRNMWCDRGKVLQIFALIAAPPK